MKNKKIIPLITILAIILSTACQKYEVVPYETKIKSYISGKTEVMFFYNNSGYLKTISSPNKEINFIYKNNLIKEVTTVHLENKDTTYTKILFPKENGLVYKSVVNNDTIYYEYDENSFLIQTSYHRYISNNLYKTITKYVIEDENITQIINSDDTTYIEYDYEKPGGVFEIGDKIGQNFYGKNSKNAIKYINDTEYEYSYNNMGLVEQITTKKVLFNISTNQYETSYSYLLINYY